MKLYQLHEEDRQFLYSLLYATGIILFWRGIWDVSYRLPFLQNDFFVLFVGLFILTMTGYMYREFEPYMKTMHKFTKLLNEIVAESKTGKGHQIHYYDEIKGEHRVVHAKNIKNVDHQFLTVEDNGREFFIPTHRIRKIHKGKEVVWLR